MDPRLFIATFGVVLFVGAALVRRRFRGDHVAACLLVAAFPAIFVLVWAGSPVHGNPVASGLGGAVLVLDVLAMLAGFAGLFGRTVMLRERITTAVQLMLAVPLLAATAALFVNRTFDREPPREYQVEIVGKKELRSLRSPYPVSGWVLAVASPWMRDATLRLRATEDVFDAARPSIDAVRLSAHSGFLGYRWVDWYELVVLPPRETAESVSPPGLPRNR